MSTPEIRIGDAQRLVAQDRIQQAYAQGALDFEEFEERLGLALMAKTPSDLEPLLADLPFTAAPPPPPRPVAAHRPHRADRIRNSIGGAAVILAVALLGVIVARADAVALFSSTTYVVDQQAVQFAEDGQVDIDVLSLFGSVEVVVPSPVAVRSNTLAIFGSAECDACTSGTTQSDEGSVVVEVGGASVFGSVEIVRG